MRYEVTFDRIGNHRPVEPEVFEVSGADELRLKIHEHVNRYVPGIATIVQISFSEMCGEIHSSRDYGSLLGSLKIREVTNEARVR